MGRAIFALSFSLLLLITGVSFAPSYHRSAKMVCKLVSDAVSVLMKCMWSLKTTSKTAAVSSRPVMKFESGYKVETVFDGGKVGVEPYAVEVLPTGEFLILDSANSNIHKISSSLSPYSRPKLMAGSAEGYSGHVDGRRSEARLNHPKGITVDYKGNIYVADVDNMAIRRISDKGVTTIAGGNWGRSAGYVDGPGEDAKFSSDFDVVYVESSCSLLVVDRGNKAIREIQLHFNDCTEQYGTDYPLGIAVLVAACFFGYMLSLLQMRVSSIFSSSKEPMQTNFHPSLYQEPMKSVRPPLIPTEDVAEKSEDSLFDSEIKLSMNAGDCVWKILAGLIPGRRKKPHSNEYTSQQIFSHQQRPSNTWPAQETFVIPREDEPPPIDTRSPRKTYPFMLKDSEKLQQIRRSRVFYRDQQQHRNSSAPQTVFGRSWDNREEIFIGAVQRQQGMLKNMVINPVDHGSSNFNDHDGFHHHYNSNDYGYGYEAYT